MAVTDKSGTTGYGECAPLPDYSRETMGEAKSELVDIARRLQNFDMADSAPLDMAAELCGESVASSVQFAVESALLSLAASEAGEPVAATLSPDFALSVPVNALIESNDNLSSRLAELAAHNCRAVKLKVGRLRLAEDIKTVKQTRDTLPPHITLRLDANRAWTLDQAVQFAQGIQHCRIEYIEEPLRESAELALLHEAAPNLPLAVDESVRDMDIDYFRRAAHFSAAVIKPTVVGGISRSLAIARACRRSGKKAVLGASIESSLGLLMIAQMAAALVQDVPIGLDTARLFSRDLITPSLKTVDFSVEIDRGSIHNCALNQDLIEEVSLG